jgi:hypothetical protein
MMSDAETLSGVGDADERRLQIALDVDGESFDRRNIEDAAAMSFGGNGRKHEAIDAPEEGGESFAGAGGSKDERGVTASDGGPAEELGASGSGEDGGEPVADSWVEESEAGGGAGR